MWLQELLDKDEENRAEDDLENLEEGNLENLDEGDLENLIAENPEEEGDKEDKKSVVEEDQEDLDDEVKNLDEGVQETLNKANQESFNMCMNLLKSSQSAMRLAVSEWNGLLVKINRRCRTVVLHTSAENEWGETKMESFEEFQEKQFSENSNRQKRHPALLYGLGFFLAIALVGVIAYAVSNKVSTDHMEEVEDVMKKGDKVMINAMNKTNQEVKSLSGEVLSLKGKVNTLEKYVQIQEFAHQSLEAAKVTGKFLVSKLYLDEHDFATLDLQFHDVLLDEVSEMGLEEEEENIQLFQLKQRTNYLSFVDHGEDFKCNSSSVMTVMSATVLESDSTLYRKLNNSDGFRSHKDDKITYENRYGMELMEQDMRSKNMPEPSRSLLANRRFTSLDDTRLLFTESSQELSDRFTVFFLGLNDTMERHAFIHCSNSSSPLQFHKFKSGSSIDLPIYCALESHWLNASAIQIKTSNTTILGSDTFKMNWKPIPSPTEVCHDCVFDGSSDEVVEELHIIREDFHEAYTKISTKKLLDSVVTAEKETLSFGEMIANHFKDHGMKYGFGAISLFALLVSFIAFLKMGGCSSAAGNGKLNEFLKKIYKSQFISPFSGYGHEMVVINNRCAEPGTPSKSVNAAVLVGEERKKVNNEGIYSLLNIDICNL